MMRQLLCTSTNSYNIRCLSALIIMAIKSWLDFEFTRLYAMSCALARSYDSPIHS